uniref:Reverse transcriptase domain-containing protein n=1 Tax=Oreochromis niloticus TaxID=8128 RepID=A0A669DIK2_ORENI
MDQIPDVRAVKEDQMSFCDRPISISEVLPAIRRLKLNKSPGTDGLTSEFYITFADQLAPFLLNVYIESLINQSLPPTLSQGLLTLIPKPKKDPTYIDNWRPICLLNNDYKILAQIFAKRLKAVLNDITDETQSGFMANRHISNNIRLVFDLIDYADLCRDDSFILFVDFCKAFDTIEHGFIFQALDKFGFGSYFQNAIKTMYKNVNCSIKLQAGTSPRFNLNRSIRQGCPISPYLFLICAQLLSDYIKRSPLKGITIADKEIFISQLADDTTLFLKNASQVQMAINTINAFSLASGLHLNIGKCELLALRNCNSLSIAGIPVKESVTYLGIIINKNQSTRCSLNFTPILDKTQRKLNAWLQRDLSIKGRVLLTKAEGLSRLTYAALSLDVNKETLGDIDRLLYNFIWKNRIHYIKRSVLSSSYQHGGVNFLDFSSLNNVFKINWIKQFFRSPTSIWNFIPNYIFSKIGGLNFLLLCNYNINKIPLKLSNFHKQMLLSWSLIYKHNFSPHRYYIWNNRDILYKHKSVFLSNWFDNGIHRVAQLINPVGGLLSYSEFMNTYGLPVPPKEYAIVFDAIPAGVLMLFRNPVVNDLTPLPLDPAVTYVGQVCFPSIKRKNNREIRTLFQKDRTCVPTAVAYWNNLYQDLEWEKIWTLPSKFLLNNKVKEISFKVIHRFYPTRSFLVRYKKDIDVNCTFCNCVKEDISHLFWSCLYTNLFWQEFCVFVVSLIFSEFSLCYEKILFGFFKYPMHRANEFYLINLLILLAKFHIHKSKFSNAKPSFKCFLNETKQYVKTIQHSQNLKAVKTINLCSLFNIM